MTGAADGSRCTANSPCLLVNDGQSGATAKRDQKNGCKEARQLLVLDSKRWDLEVQKALLGDMAPNKEFIRRAPGETVVILHLSARDRRTSSRLA